MDTKDEEAATTDERGWYCCHTLEPEKCQKEAEGARTSRNNEYTPKDFTPLKHVDAGH